MVCIADYSPDANSSVERWSSISGEDDYDEPDLGGTDDVLPSAEKRASAKRGSRGSKRRHHEERTVQHTGVCARPMTSRSFYFALFPSAQVHEIAETRNIVLWGQANSREV